MVLTLVDPRLVNFKYEKSETTKMTKTPYWEKLTLNFPKIVTIEPMKEKLDLLKHDECC